ncbi:MAG: Trk family potassium uptake protein [Ruminococcaceae bacterium]|nr:Trk family potassium uptake protein [Oscillospiraceae bacterium]
MVKKKKLSPVQIITLSFAAVTLIGAVLLSLPIASRGGEVSFIDALFTSTSASCVTGLVVGDTYSMWSPFGQAVIIALIQIGGIGIITLVMYFLSVLGAKIGVKGVFMLQETMGADSLSGLVKMTRFIAAGILIVELCGALLLMPVFIPDFGVLRGVLYSFFHSISAFCNAGFDLMGYNGGSSLTAYCGDIYFNIVICALIVFSGLGFFVWLDLLKCKFRFSKLSLHSKIVLVTTTWLVLGGAILFFILFNNSAAAADLSLSEKVTASFFQSVTARTAGFYTVDLVNIGGAAQMLMIVLMLIGGSPASTAGGIKTTTFAVLILFVRSIFSGKEDVEVFGRRIEKNVQRTAVAVFVLYLGLALCAGIAISAIEGADIVACLFETFSAIATVGLSLSLTPTFSETSKIIVIVLMFIGRVGGITVLLSLTGKKSDSAYRYPAENITVG